MYAEKNRRISKRNRISSLIRTGEKIAILPLIGFAALGFAREKAVEKAYQQYWNERPGLVQAMDKVERVGYDLLGMVERNFPTSERDVNETLTDLQNIAPDIEIIRENKKDVPPRHDLRALTLMLITGVDILAIGADLRNKKLFRSASKK